MRAQGRGAGRGTQDGEEEETWSQETPFVSSGLVVPGKGAVSPPPSVPEQGRWAVTAPILPHKFPGASGQAPSATWPQLSSPSQAQPWSTSTSANYSHFGNTLSWIKRTARAPGGGAGERAGRGGEEGEACKLSGLSLTSPGLVVWLFSTLTGHSAPSTRAPGAPPRPRFSRAPTPTPAPSQADSHSRASPTDARLPVGMEHELDMAATPGTLLCVIARVLAAAITVVARHCAERAGGLSACCSPGPSVLHSTETGPLL